MVPLSRSGYLSAMVAAAFGVIFGTVMLSAHGDGKSGGGMGTSFLNVSGRSAGAGLGWANPYRSCLRPAQQLESSITDGVHSGGAGGVIGSDGSVVVSPPDGVSVHEIAPSVTLVWAGDVGQRSPSLKDAVSTRVNESPGSSRPHLWGRGRCFRSSPAPGTVGFLRAPLLLWWKRCPLWKVSGLNGNGPNGDVGAGSRTRLMSRLEAVCLPIDSLPPPPLLPVSSEFLLPSWQLWRSPLSWQLYGLPYVRLSRRFAAYSSVYLPC